MNKRFLVALIFIMGCGAPRASAPVGIRMSAQTSFCSGKGTAFAPGNVNKVRVIVTGKKDAVGKTIALLDHNTSVGSQGQITVPDIQESSDACVTLLATMKDGAQWYARRRHLDIKANRPVDLDMVLEPFGRFVCVGNDVAGIKPVMFPATVSLVGGRILIAGGFTKAEYDKTAHTVTLSEPSRQAYIYDSYKGTFQKVKSLMSEGRAAFAMVNLNVEMGEQVVVFGGAKKMVMHLDAGASMKAFPLQWSAADSLKSYEVFDVAKLKFLVTGKDADGVQKQMNVPRVFPRAVALHDNTVLVTGGGLPPKDAYQYMGAQIYSPYEDNEKGNFQPDCDCLNMQVQRNGHAIAKIVTTSLPKRLIIGGTTDPKHFAEIYMESSLQKDGINGAFHPITLNKGLPLMFFPSLSPLGDSEFLLTGGLDYDPKTRSFKASNDAYYILSVNKDASAITVNGGTFKGLGRFFHQAMVLPEVGLVAIAGGFNDFSGKATGNIIFYNMKTHKFMAQPVKDDAFVPKVGFSGIALPDDTFMFVGGGNDYTNPAAGNSLAEIYSSSAVPVELYK